ncbi:hypothetical protein DFAR_2970001 [Desulfarculales bacterium]
MARLIAGLFPLRHVGRHFLGHKRTSLSRSAILGWVRLYRQGGGKLESLYPMGSNDRGGSMALDEDTAQAMVRLRR